MIDKLIANGCSYMNNYTKGHGKNGGHVDLAKRLNMSKVDSIDVPGSANSRILRTTLKHSYMTQEPTFYLLGMTFVSREEIPILRVDDEHTFEGRWNNPANQIFIDRWEHHWTKKDVERYVDFQRKWEVYSLLDRTENLMYMMLAAIDSLHSRGHQVLMYQQADTDYWSLYDNPKLNLFASTPCIVNAFRWSATKYQHDMGVPPVPIDPSLPQSLLPIPHGPVTPDYQKKPSDHTVLNEFLVDYIHEHKLLDV